MASPEQSQSQPATVAEATVADTAPECAAAPPTPAKSRRVASGSAILVLFLLGALIGWASLPPGPPRDEANLKKSAKMGQASKGAKPKSDSQRPEPDEKSDLAAGDLAFRENRSEQALKLLQALASRGKGPAPLPLQIRIALCLEDTGKWDKALGAYRRIFAEGGEKEALFAELGQARIFFKRGQASECSKLLSATLSGRSGPPDAPLVAEGRLLLALALAVDAVPNAKTGPHEERPVAPWNFAWNLPKQLEHLAAWKPAIAAKNTTAIEEIVVQQATAKSDQVLLRAQMSTMPVVDLLERLAQAGGLRTRWTAAARQLCDNRQASLLTSDRPLLEVLRGVGDCMGLVCHVLHDQLHLESIEEKPPEFLADYRIGNARRALQSAIIAYPEHWLTPVAFLSLGNVEMADGKRAEALTWYKRIPKDASRSRLSLEASFNIGLAHLALGQITEAQVAFYQVVDQAPFHELAPQAHLRLGLSFLEGNQPKKAVSAFKAAKARAADGPTRAVAALALGAAHLLDDEPLSGLDVLRKNREFLQHEPYRASTAFLSAYAKLRAALKRKNVNREANDLLAALLELGSETNLGAVGKLIVATSYVDLGMWDQAALHYKQLLPEVKGPLAEEVRFRLGAVLVQQRNAAEATPLLSALAKGSGPWTAPAQFHLAKLDLHEDRVADCLQRGRKLLYEAANVNHAELLALLAQAYERSGNFAQAARCLAGQLPDD